MTKRLVSLLLTLAIVSSFAMGIVFMEKKLNTPEASIAILSDMHIVAESRLNEENYDYYANRDKMEHLSVAIAKTIVDDIIKDKSIKIVFMPGDLTEDGDIASHKVVASLCKKLTDSGKKVFVINGNHDGTKNILHLATRASAESFREIYWEFGYKDAIIRDDKSLSYVADINDKFRIIAIDNDDYYSTDINEKKEEMDDRLMEWVVAQVQKAIADGKTPLAMSHKPLVDHMPAVFNAIVGEKMANPIFINLATLLADNGCKYIFTGHFHGQDIAIHTTEKGNKIADIETSSTVYLPVAYRVLKFSKDKVKISSIPLQKLNMDYVSKLNTSEDYTKIRDDFRGYAKEHLIKGNRNKIMSSISSSSLGFLTNLPNSIAEFAEFLIDDIGVAVMNMPFYGNGTDKSLEQIVTENGGTMPPSDYKNLIELISQFIIIVNSGDENVAKDVVELELLKKCVLSMFYFLNHQQLELQEMYPDSPIIDIDLERLFVQGELEVIDSNLIDFAYHIGKDMLPKELRNLSIKNLVLIKGVTKALVNEMSEGMGTKIVSFMGTTEIRLDALIEEMVFDYLLKDALIDDFPGDNNVTFDRATLMPI